MRTSPLRHSIQCPGGTFWMPSTIVRSRHVVQRRVVMQAFRVQTALDLRMGEERLQFRAEIEIAPALVDNRAA